MLNERTYSIRVTASEADAHSDAKQIRESNHREIAFLHRRRIYQQHISRRTDFGFSGC